MTTLQERLAAKSAIKKLHAPGLRKLARNPLFVDAVIETTREMQAKHIDASKVLSVLAQLQEKNAIA